MLMLSEINADMVYITTHKTTKCIWGRTMKIQENNSIRKIQISILLFLCLWYLLKLLVATYDVISPKVIEDYFEIIGESVAIYMIMHGILSNRIITKRIWYLFAIGIFCNLFADLIWNINELMFHRTMPFVSFLDVFYLSGSVFFILANFAYLGKKEAYSLIKTSFDVGIIMAASMTLLYKYILMPIWINEQLSLLERLVLILYPVFDLGYLTIILAYILNKNIISPKFRVAFFLMIGFSFLFVADIVYTVETTNFITYILDPFWVIGYICIAMASLYSNRNMIESYQKNMSLEKKGKYRDYILFLAPYMVACIFILTFNLRYIYQDSLAVGATVTLILIMLRQIFVLLENKRLLNMVEDTNIQMEEYALHLDQKNKTLYQLKKEKEREASIDYLTQLYNRRYVSEWIRSELKELNEDDMLDSSTILIDIDHYKEINDQYGHNTGDLVLQEISQIIRDSIRISDIAARQGGDEFLLVLPNTELQTAEMIGKRLGQKVREMQFQNYPELKVTLSIGIVYWKGTKKQYSEDKIVNEADRMLYEAKNGGRDKIVSKRL